MNQLTFAVMMLLPSVALCFVILSTFYGWVKAYLAISWIPVTLFLVIYLFLNMEYTQNAMASSVNLMLSAVAWTSFIQGLFGITLVIRALYRKEDWVIPAIATLLTGLPFFLIN